MTNARICPDCGGRKERQAERCRDCNDRYKIGPTIGPLFPQMLVIRGQLRRQRVSLSALARLAGVDRKTVLDNIHGRYAPTLGTLELYARALGLRRCTCCSGVGWTESQETSGNGCGARSEAASTHREAGA